MPKPFPHEYHGTLTWTQGRLVGLVTQRDYLTFSISKLAHLPKAKRENINEHLRICDIRDARSPPLPLSEATELVFREKFGCLPVLKE